jgi:hypothetical protein
MGPGVPGMGIASIFYLTAALFAPLREVVKSVRGESSAQRWKAVGLQFAIAVGTVSSIVLLYLGFDALISNGVFGPLQPIDLPGDLPVWTYALGVLIILLLALALASWVLALRVRWGSIGADTEQITHVYRASIPVHEDLHQDGISKGRHRASSPPSVTSLSGPWNQPATAIHLPTAVDQRLIRGRHLDEPIFAS